MQDRNAALAALAGHFWNQRPSVALPLPPSKPSTALGTIPLGSDPPTDPPGNSQQPPPPPLLPNILSAVASQPTASRVVPKPSSPAHPMPSMKAGDPASPKTQLPASGAIPTASYRMRSPRMHQQPLAKASQTLPVRNNLDPAQPAVPGSPAATDKADGEADTGSAQPQVQAGAFKDADMENIASSSAQHAKQAQHDSKLRANRGAHGSQSASTKGGARAKVDAAGIAGWVSQRADTLGSLDSNLPGSVSEREARAGARRSRQTDRSNAIELQVGQDSTSKQRLVEPLQGGFLSSAEGLAGKAGVSLAAQTPSAGKASTAGNTSSVSTGKEAAHTRATGKSRRGSAAAAAASKAEPAGTPSAGRLAGKADSGNTPKTVTQDLNTAGIAGSAGVKSDSRTLDRSLSDREARAAARVSRQAAKVAGQALQEAGQTQDETGQALPEAVRTHYMPGPALQEAGQTNDEATQTHDTAGQALPGADHNPGEGSQALARASQAPDKVNQVLKDNLSGPRAPDNMPSTARAEAGQLLHGTNTLLPSITAQLVKDSQFGPDSTPTIPQCDGAGDEEAQNADQLQLAAPPVLANPLSDPSGGSHLSTAGAPVVFLGLQPLHNTSNVTHGPLSYPPTSTVANPNTVTSPPDRPLDAAGKPPGLQHGTLLSVQAAAATLSDPLNHPPQQQQKSLPSVLEQIAARYMSQGKVQPSSSIQFTGIASDIPVTKQMAITEPPSLLHSRASDALMPAHMATAQQAEHSTGTRLTDQHRACTIDPLSVMQNPAAESPRITHNQQLPLQQTRAHLAVPNQAAAQQPSFSSGTLSQTGVPNQATAQRLAFNSDSLPQSPAQTVVPVLATAQQPAFGIDAAAQPHAQTAVAVHATAQQPAICSSAAAQPAAQTDVPIQATATKLAVRSNSSQAQTHVPAQATTQQPAFNNTLPAHPHAQTGVPIQATAPQPALPSNALHAQTDALGQATARQLDLIRAQAAIVAAQLSPPQLATQVE